jgi:hypothetical protein
MVDTRLDHLRGFDAPEFIGAGKSAVESLWPVYRFTIVDAAPHTIERYLATAPQSIAGSYGGAFIPEEGFKEGRHLPAPLGYYMPTAHAGDILSDATRLDPSNRAALLDFVNRWGVLGIVDSRWERVMDTVQVLSDVVRLARWLAALQAGKWKSPDIPPLGDTVKRSPAEARKIRWRLFASELDRDAPEVRPGLSFDQQSRSHPYFRVRRMIDALRFHLWQIASSHDNVLRLCVECGGLFSVARTNQLQRFCSATCKNRRNYRRWYAHPDNKAKVSESRRAKRREK